MQGNLRQIHVYVQQLLFYDRDRERGDAAWASQALTGGKHGSVEFLPYRTPLASGTLRVLMLGG